MDYHYEFYGIQYRQGGSEIRTETAETHTELEAST